MNTETVAPLAHSPEGAAKRLGISVRAVYTLIASGDIRSYKEGKRRIIPDIECQRRVQRKTEQAEVSA
jgi:excisionase family DNA binding protein